MHISQQPPGQVHLDILEVISKVIQPKDAHQPKLFLYHLMGPTNYVITQSVPWNPIFPSNTQLILAQTYSKSVHPSKLVYTLVQIHKLPLWFSFFPHVQCSCSPYTQFTGASLQNTNLNYYGSSFVDHLPHLWRSLFQPNPWSKVQYIFQSMSCPSHLDLTCQPFTPKCLCTHTCQPSPPASCSTYSWLSDSPWNSYSTFKTYCQYLFYNTCYIEL